MERRTVRCLAILAIFLIMLPAMARASGGTSMPPPSSPPTPRSALPETPRKSPAEEAIEHYNAGIRHRDKALESQKEAAQATGEKERGKLESKARKEFEKALGEFRQATQLNPRFHEAFSDMGFVLRKTGDYAGALEAYNRALVLAAEYAPAIEYRAEACLGLDRVDDAKQAYMQLFPKDRSRADELLAAMQEWVEKRRSDPGKLTPEMVQAFDAWVQERAELAKQTPSVSELQKRKW